MHKLLPILVLLAACGGGGDPAPPAPPTPRAVNDSATVDEDGTVSISILSNDTSVSASTLALGDAPQNGSAVVNGNSIDYTPDAEYSGSDSFTYTIDSTAGNELTATVTVTVTEINDDPVANDDTISLTEDTPTTVDITSNDTDVDSEITSVAIISEPENGTVTTSDTVITYTPHQDYVGADEFTYNAIDASGGESNAATVTIDVLPVTETILTVTNLPIPTTNYASENNPEYEDPILTSPEQLVEIPPNTVSFLLTLRGPAIGEAENSLFIADLESPGMSISPFKEVVNFCDGNLCSSLVPRVPDIPRDRGTWRFKLGTIDSTLDDVDFSDLALDLAIRTGPEPDLSTNFPGTLKVKPFLTATGVTQADLKLVLDRMVAMADDQGISIELLPTTVLTDPRFEEVSEDFLDTTTSELVALGDADTVNLFFLDSFAGPRGNSLAGISAGIPSALGSQSGFNGVLINALAFGDEATEFFIRNTARTSLHEVGHHLGLYHTTEGDFSNHDVLDDTPVCDSSLHDENGNEVANASECPDGDNLMFWRPSFFGNDVTVSVDQRRVIYTSPITKPDKN